MFQRLAGDPRNLVHLRQVEAALRRRFSLPPEVLVLLREDAARLPGFPPRETVIRFWLGDARYRLKLFKPAAEISAADLPVAWLLPSLLDDGDPDCC